MMSLKRLLAAQSLLLLGGAAFAWSKLVPQLVNFQALYGTFFKVSGCIVPNPFLTACFYGSAAFLVALYGSFLVYQKPSVRGERRLRNFLLFGVVFASSVVLTEVLTYYKIFTMAVSVTCSPGVPPLETPCFTGMLFFIAAFVVSVFATKKCQSDTVSL